MPSPMQGAPATTELPLRPQDELECRRCEVHCDKVVYPSACIDRACPFLYAFEEFGHTYIGCMQKVYGVEIDLEMLREAEARREGFGGMRTTRAAADVPRRGGGVLRRRAVGRARLRQSRVSRASRWASDLQGLRSASGLSSA
jgi:hypothetical protein